MISLGITGSSGFLGHHLVQRAEKNGNFRIIPFCRSYFDSIGSMAEWAGKCDAVMHFAAVSRHENGEYLYAENMRLTKLLAEVLHGQTVVFASTTHGAKDTLYHASKRDGAELLKKYDCKPVILRMPNAFGEYGRPFYNSVVSTFCAIAAEGKAPERIDNVTLNLIYAGTLADAALNAIFEHKSGTVTVPFEFEVRLPELWRKLEKMRENSFAPESEFDRCLFKTFKWYCENKK